MTNKVIIGLLCVVIVLLAVNLFVNGRTIYAAGYGSSDSGFMMITGINQATQGDVLYLLDTKERTLLVYDMNRGGLQLRSARTIKYDLYLDEWKAKSQDPSYEKIKTLTRQKWSPTEEKKKPRGR